MFRDAETFQSHERAWRQYLIHVNQKETDPEARQRLIDTTSVIGSEHVLNDRYIPFTAFCAPSTIRSVGPHRKLMTPAGTRKSASTRPAAAARLTSTRLPMKCSFAHAAPWQQADRRVQLQLTMDGTQATTAPCDEPVAMSVPYPKGGTVSVGVDGETPISIDVQVKDLLIVGLGDSFASGEGNPDVPVRFDAERRARNVYPKRKGTDANSNAQWLDELCHRSLYGHQLRAALQIAVENPKAAVTFMGYACSGAAVEEGILGPQTYMDYVNRGETGGLRSVKGGSKDTQLRWLLRELCNQTPDSENGIWRCPDNDFRRNVDFLMLSVGGNDIGFSNLVGWATLRDSTSSALAKFFGATVSPKQFSANMQDSLPKAYARLAKAIETAVPLRNGDLNFDASRVVLSAYPDILEDETGNVCSAGGEGDEKIFSLPTSRSTASTPGWW